MTPTVNMPQLARDVAAALGDGWTGSDHVNTMAANVEHTDGRKLFLLHTRFGRVEITGCYPGNWYRRREVRITVGPGRPPVAIARDIQRRFLPAYEADLVKARERHAEIERAEAGREHVTRRILALLRGARRSQIRGRDNWETEVWLPPTPGEPYGCGWAKVRDDGNRVALEIDYIPPETALRILSLIYGINPERVPAADPQHRARHALRRLRGGHRQ